MLLAVGLLAVAALAAYRNTFTAPFVLDDGDAVTENASIRRLWPPWPALAPPPGGATVSGRPLLNFSLAVNYAISGESVWSYHALNLLIHFLASCALFGVVRRSLGRVERAVPGPPALVPAPSERRVEDNAPYSADATGVAFAIALLWLLHPLQTEAVTYVSQRAESLAGLFVLLTLYAFIRAVGAADSFQANHKDTKAPSSSEPRRSTFVSSCLGGLTGWSALAVLACLLAVATKEIAVLAPVLVFLYDRTFVAGTFREAWRRRRWLHLSLAATWVPLALLVAGSGWNRGGTAGFNAGVPPWAYWLTQFKAVAYYLTRILWPHPLIFEYGTFWVPAPLAVLRPGVVVVGLLAVVLWALWKRPAAGFLGAWFFGILAPTSIVPGTNQMIVEHRLYLPLAAAVTLAVTGLHAVLGRRTRVLWPVLAVGLGWLTYERNATYGSALSLWRDTAARVPRNARARYNLGIVYSEEGRYADAVREDEAALQFAHGLGVEGERPAIDNKLGYDLAALGRLPEAVARYEEALRLKPAYGIAHFNLARALVRLHRYPEAIRHYREALRLGSGGEDAESELGDALMHEGRFAEAAAHWQAAVRLAPAWAPGFNNLAYALLLTGDAEAAIADYREAVRLDPRYTAAWVGLGYALIQAGRPAEAVAPCLEAARLQPDFADAHNTLGIAYAQSGHPGQAIACFERALRLGENGADVHNNLGNALSAVGRRAEAIAQYREALTVDPDYAPAHRNLGGELRRAGREAEAAEQFAAAARLEAAAPNGARATRPPEQAPAGH